MDYSMNEPTVPYGAPPKAVTQRHCPGLLSKQPIVIDVDMACKLSLNEAIFIQQLHYWLGRYAKKPSHIHDGRVWVWNAISVSKTKKDEGVRSWKDNFPFWSASTIRRTIQQLTDRGIIISNEFNRMKGDRTIWYTIDYDVLSETLSVPFAHNEQTPSAQNEQTHLLKMTSALPESSISEINLKTPISPRPADALSEPPKTDSPPKPAKPTVSAADHPLFSQARDAYRKLKPRMPGLDKAFDRFKRQHPKTWKKDIADLLPAIANYARECQEQDRAPQYVKDWTTFVGPQRCWEEYLQTPEFNADSHGQPTLALTRPHPTEDAWTPIPELPGQFRAVGKPGWRKAPCGEIYHVNDSSKPASTYKSIPEGEAIDHGENTRHLSALAAKWDTPKGDKQ